MDVSKCTPGPVTAKRLIRIKDKPRVIAYLCGFWSILAQQEVKEEHEQFDAELIKEAFTVATETGMSPAQLVQMISDLKSLVAHYRKERDRLERQIQ